MVAAAHAIVADLAAPCLDADDRHHLERVLRLRVGACVTVADGEGGWLRCSLGPSGRLDHDGEVNHQRRAVPSITVAFAVTKGERPELAVQKLTELGVDRIIPFTATRSVARWEGERAVRHIERLRRVARGAAVQSRRAWLPEITELSDLEALLGSAEVALADPDGAPPSLGRPTIVVGPEGGFTSEERAMAGSTVRLGPLVLRAETAAIAAGAILVALRSGVARPA